jgi:hypothetical protein
MGAKESLIAVGLAVVLVVAVVDAAAGHDDTSCPSPQPSSEGLATASASAAPTTSAPLPGATKPKGGGHRHHAGATPPTATPTSLATSAATSAAPSEPESSAPAPSRHPGSATALPPGVLGTFTYDTTGGEGTNIPGTTRTFPKQTKIKNKREGCGVSSTWSPIPQHVQKQVLCPGSDGIKVTSYETTISFYGVSSGENFTCSGPSYVYRNHVSPGDTWKFKCKSPDAVAVQTTRAVGYDKISVGGTSVRTLHVHIVAKLTGGSSGTSTQDVWIATDKPILVKETGKVAANQKNVRYSSSYSLTLTSLSPKT